MPARRTVPARPAAPATVPSQDCAAIGKVETPSPPSSPIGALGTQGSPGRKLVIMQLRGMRASDAAGILSIYQAGLDTGDASFETTAPTWEAFDAGHLPDHRHVAVDPSTGELLGWIAVSAVS